MELFLQESPGKKFPPQRELVNEIRAEMDLPQSPYSRAAYSVKRLWKFAAAFLIFIGLISTMMMVTFAMIWKYFPLIDAKEDRLVMLGGLIDIDKRLGPGQNYG